MRFGYVELVREIERLGGMVRLSRMRGVEFLVVDFLRGDVLAWPLIGVDRTRDIERMLELTLDQARRSPRRAGEMALVVEETVVEIDDAAIRAARAAILNGPLPGVAGTTVTSVERPDA